MAATAAVGQAGNDGDGFLRSQQALDSMRFCEQLLMESVRFAQRSITLRKVMKEIQFDGGSETYTIQPGVYITTMLSVTNTQTPELARFDPLIAEIRASGCRILVTPIRNTRPV